MTRFHVCLGVTFIKKIFIPKKIGGLNHKKITKIYEIIFEREERGLENRWNHVSFIH
jgi:hypothetical protein